MVEKKIFLKLKFKLIRLKNGKSVINDVFVIVVDEVWVKEIMMEIVKEVGKIVCELIYFGVGCIFLFVFSWVIKLV